MRHLWLNLLENLQNESSSIPVTKDSVFWANFFQMTLDTKNIITSAFNPSILSAVNAEFETKNISPIYNFTTKLEPNEPYPFSKATKMIYLLILLDFKAILSKSKWVDWKICETLIKNLRPIWRESVFSQAGITGGSSEAQKLEKRIHNLLDITQIEDQWRTLLVLSYSVIFLK